MRKLCNSFALVAALCAFTGIASAQAGVEAYFGVGTATDSSNNTSIDTFNTGNTGPVNTPGYYNTPKLTGTFGKAGGQVMFSPHFGAGADIDFRFSQADYAGLNYRPTFYDFYGVYQPFTKAHRVVPQFFGGLGAVNISYTYPQSYCDAFAGCSSSNSYVESSKHFQVRMGAAVELYATSHVFIKPEVDVHYVDNFFQFGSNWVPEYSVSVGYHFGER